MLRCANRQQLASASERRDVAGCGKRLLTVGQVADLLQVPQSWVYERTRRRGAEQLPHIKLGKYIRFEEDAVRAFLERQRTRT